MNELVLALLLFATPLPGDDAPPESDLSRFPPAGVVKDSWRFASHHVSWIYERQGCEKGLSGPNDRVWAEWLLEAKWRCEAFNILDNAHNARIYGNHTAGYRCRDHLALLRDHIGPAAYGQGALPACVPLWRFRQGNATSVD